MQRLIRYGQRFVKPLTSEIVFFVNQEEICVRSPDVEITLGDFLRDNYFRSVKISCDTGVCGSCTVVIQEKEKESGDVFYKSVNSCKYPLYQADGKHFLTSEISEKADSLFTQIQTHMAGKGGSQCGFCSPGIMMNLYSEIMNNPKIKEIEIDRNLNNNQCRCTGYRPILHAIEDVLENPDLSDTISYPSELEDYSISGKSVELSDGIIWHKPSNLQEFVKHFNSKPDSIVVGGGIEGYKGGKNLVDTTFVKEFNEISFFDTTISVGSSVTLEELARFCEFYKDSNSTFEALNDCCQRLATKQIRNMGTIVGNILSSSFVDELLLVLAVVDTKIKYLDVDGKEAIHFARDLLKNRSFESIVVTGVEIPLMKDNEYVKYQKVSGRYYSSLPIINSAIHASFGKTGEVEDCRVVFGGLMKNNQVFRAHKTKEGLIGNCIFEESVLKSTLNQLSEEMKELSDQFNYLEGKIEYKQTLVLSMMKKFFHVAQMKFFPDSVDPRDKSILNPICKTKPLKTKIEFEEVMQGSLHGKAIDNFKALVLSSGDAEYVGDIPRYEGELICHIVTSKVPHGVIKNIDASAVLESTGVHCFVTADDIEEYGGLNLFGVAGVMDEEILASETVQAVGQPVGIIVAESLKEAKDASKKLVIDIEELPHIISVDEAIKQNSYHDFYPQLKDGDVEQGLEDSQFVVEGSFEIGGQDHSYAETHANIVVPTENGEMRIYAATQDCGGLQKHAAMVLNVPQHKLVVKTKRMGGGFGGKQSRGGYFAILNSLAARKAKRPTRLDFEREMDMTISGGRHPYKSEYKVGFDETGKINSLWLDIFSNGGYCMELTHAIMDKAMLCYDQGYKIDNVLVSGYCCKTNTMSNTAFRGFGAPQSQMIMEEIVEQVADFLEMDSAEIRRINMYEEGDYTPFGLELKDCHLERIWDQLREKFDYETKKEEVEEFNKNNKYRKRGIHLMPAKCGMGYCDSPFLNAGASLVHIYQDGSVLVSIGGTEMGQGLFAKVAQVCANTLGLPIEKVNVIETATDKTAAQPPTAASIGSDVFGGATQNACFTLMERLGPLMDELGYPEKASWEDVVINAWLRKTNLTCHGYYEMFHVTPPSWEHEWIGDRWRELPRIIADPFPYLIYGGVATEVEVDCLTGEIRMLRCDLIEDVGDSINPTIDIGQVEGSFIQGLGYCTSEEVIMGGETVDYLPPGEFYNNSFLKYHVPLSNEIPEEFNVSLLENCGTKWHSSFMNSKTSGEPPFFLGQSAFFAIRNAVKDFRGREMGIVDTVDTFVFNSPATSERIRMACADDILKLVVNDNPESFKAKGHV